MVDELKPIEKSWFTDRIRLGERYLRDCIDKIANKNAYAKNKIKKRQKKDEPEDGNPSPYEGLSISKEKPHSLDEEI